MFDLHAVVAGDPTRFSDLRIMLDAPLARRVQGIVAKAMQRVDVTRDKVRPLWLGKQVFRQLALDDTEPDDIQAALDIVAMTLTGSRGDTSRPIARGNALARQWRALTEPPTKSAPDRSCAPHGPTVIVCGSVDGRGGAAASWLPTLLPDARHTIAATGYTAPLSVMGRGRRVGRSAAQGAPPPPRQHRVEQPPDVSDPRDRRHRDAPARLLSPRRPADLLDWVFLRRQDGDSIAAPTLFVQHGEDRERAALRTAILQRASETGQRINVILPQREDAWIALDRELEHSVAGH